MKTRNRKPATTPTRRTVGDDILEGAGAASATRARARRGARPTETATQAPAPAEVLEATSAPGAAPNSAPPAEAEAAKKPALVMVGSAADRERQRQAKKAATAPVPPAAKPAPKSPAPPKGTIKTLLRGSSAKALGFDKDRPEWLPEPVISRTGTPQESWRFNLEPVALRALVLHLLASGQNGPVTKDAKYLTTLLPAELQPPAPAKPAKVAAVDAAPAAGAGEAAAN